MFLHAEKMARSRSVTYGKDGSVEHLFALIDLCKLIEQHKKFILGHAEPLENMNRRSPNGTQRSLIRDCLSYRTRLEGSGSHT